MLGNARYLPSLGWNEGTPYILTVKNELHLGIRLAQIFSTQFALISHTLTDPSALDDAYKN